MRKIHGAITAASTDTKILTPKICKITVLVKVGNEVWGRCFREIVVEVCWCLSVSVHVAVCVHVRERERGGGGGGVGVLVVMLSFTVLYCQVCSHFGAFVCC